MPVYEYECSGCEKVFEIQQRIADGPLEACPECSGEVRKLISRSSFQLKGSGWYADGYSGASNGKATKSSSSTKGTGPTSAPACQTGTGGSACANCPAAS